MSQRYKGGVISATPPTLVAGAGASGTWTLEQQMQATAAGLWPVNGPFYIEEVFSTYLYTGNGTSQTITNGIDLAGKGGLVWLKRRAGATQSHGWFDSQRTNGLSDFLSSDLTGTPTNDNGGTMVLNADGFTRSSASYFGGAGSGNGNTYASWTFRKQAKFFDVVTYTGNGSARTIAHNLGSAPGCILVKDLTSANSWRVYHTSTGAGKVLYLNLTNAAADDTGVWNNTAPTSTVFSVGADTAVNQNGSSYVAYLFAHDAGGFGLTGTDNVISCGSYTGTATVNLGYEPQWVMIKRSNGSGNPWNMVDNMRGWLASGNVTNFQANAAYAEYDGGTAVSLTSTGFTVLSTDTDWGASGSTYIYIAIRRGPMKVPTSGTSVFEPVIYTGDRTTTRVVNTTITPDAGWFFHRDTTSGEYWFDRLRGGGQRIRPSTTGAEGTWTGAWLFDVQNAVQMTNAGADYINGSGALNGLWALKRAPSFFDEVCYTGTGSATTFSHNLGVAPEMMIVKGRSSASDWMVYTATDGPSYYYWLNDTSARRTGDATIWNSTSPTSSVFSVGTVPNVNGSGSTYVAYLFATCAGVSKVGSYTGTGSTQTISCGFTGGARFVLVKRTDTTGDWYVWDTARGMVSGTDPSLLLNSGAAEVNANSIYTTTGGFQIVSTAAGINASGGTYIYLAIA